MLIGKFMKNQIIAKTIVLFYNLFTFVKYKLIIIYKSQYLCCCCGNMFLDNN